MGLFHDLYLRMRLRVPPLLWGLSVIADTTSNGGGGNGGLKSEQLLVGISVPLQKR